MKLTYIYHSGFLITGREIMLIIDYFKDTTPNSSFIKSAIQNSPRPVYVLATHGHPDHFNPEALSWQKIRPDIRYIFSDDIRMSGLSSPRSATYLKQGETYRDEKVIIRAFGSTDLGVSFLIETENHCIFHAGDLNNWHWRDESEPEESQVYETNYLNELQSIAREVSGVDLAMFPIDARLGSDYMLGAEQFVEHIPTRTFAPMHFGEGYHRAAAFKPFAEAHGCRFIEWHRRGETIDF